MERPMLYRTVPSNGDKLSILGFGCMRLPSKAGLIDEPRAQAQLQSAIDRGVNYVDTAMLYHGGASETFLGKAGLAGGYREKVKLATKLAQWQVRTRQDMDTLLNKQLKKLKTDRIDYYLLHALDGPAWERLKALEVRDFFDRAKQDGRIVSAGFSYHGSAGDFSKIVDEYPWEMCQIQYNILDEDNQAGKAGLGYAASRGLGVVIMEPLRGGQLVRRIPAQVQKLWDRLPAPETGGSFDSGDSGDSGGSGDGGVREAHGTGTADGSGGSNSPPGNPTPAEWALRWVWNHPQVTCVLSGMNEETHIDENIRIAGTALPDSLAPEVLETAAEVREVYRRLMKVPCTGCRYCLPCPAGINIPFVFEQYNNLHMFPNRLETRFLYASRAGGVMSGKAVWASSCIKCGKCEERCPQGLPVRKLLGDVSRTLEGPVIKFLMKAGRVFLRRKETP